MAILIPNLVHAACVVNAQDKARGPRLVSALGVKSVTRSYPDSFGAFDITLERSIDARTALLYTAVNWSQGPAVSIQAVMDVDKSNLVHVYASQSLVAGGNYTYAGASGNAFGITQMSHPTTGVYCLTLDSPQHVQNDAYDGVAICVTPQSSKALAYWTVKNETEFQITTTDETGSSVDAGFSLALLPTGQGSYTVDCDFCLLVEDLGAAGVLPRVDPSQRIPVR